MNLQAWKVGELELELAGLEDKFEAARERQDFASFGCSECGISSFSRNFEQQLPQEARVLTEDSPFRKLHWLTTG